MSSAAARMFKSALAAVGAGVLLPLSLAPFDLWPLGLVSAALLLLLLEDSRPGRGALIGWCYALGQFGCGASWIFISIHQHSATAALPAAVLTLLFCAGMALLFGALPWSLFGALPGARLPKALAAFPALWVLAEWLRTWVLGGFPWLLLGYAHLETPLAGWAPAGSVLAASGAAALSAAALVCMWRGAARARFAGVLALLAAWGGGAALERIQWTQVQGAPLKVGLVQANIPLDTKWRPHSWRQTIAHYRRLSTPLWEKHDLVVWPETVLPAWPQETAAFLAETGEIAAAKGAAFVAGVAESESGPQAAAGRQFYNTVLASGQGSGRYRKRHLVPFGEYVPLERWLRGALPFFDLPMSSFSAGAARQPLLRIQGIPAAAFICYEIAFPAMAAAALPEAGLLLTVSEDAWFGRSLAPHQHLQIARMRALEAGRDLVRATNSGLSAVVDYRGRTTAQSGLFREEIVTGEVRIRGGATPFARFGTRPVLVLCLALLALCSLLPRRRTRND